MAEEQMQTMDPAYVIADLNARVRSLENKYNVLTERLLVVNQNMIEEYKKTMMEIRELKKHAKKSRLDVATTQDVINDVVKEMGIFAKKEQLKVLEKYVNLLNMFRFVTDDQLDGRLDAFAKELRQKPRKKLEV